jgi:hypothetical protein
MVNQIGEHKKIKYIMKYLKTFNENTLLKYNPTLTADDTDVASISVWRKILQVAAKTPAKDFNNSEDYINAVVVDTLSQFHTPSEQMELKSEPIIKRYGQALEEFYLKHKDK